jgi:chorismate dehydratase
VLCATRWAIAPRFVPAEPDLEAMLSRADAALLIGDPALAIDADARGLLKIDLGSEWQAMTGLPFVYAMWCGRPGVLSQIHVDALNAARDRGLAHLEEIAREYAGGDAAAEAQAFSYLRDNLKHQLGEREAAGLRRFHALAADVGVVDAVKPLTFY